MCPSGLFNSSPKSMKLFIDLEAEKFHSENYILTLKEVSRERRERRRYLDKTLHVIFSQSVSVMCGGGVRLCSCVGRILIKLEVQYMRTLTKTKNIRSLRFEADQRATPL